MLECGQSAAQGCHGQHGLRATQKPTHAWGWRITGYKCKGLGVPPPTRQGLLSAVEVIGVGPHKRRCTRPAIQVLVATTHGEIGMVGFQRQWHRSRTVGQIPHRQSPDIVGPLAPQGHVPHRPGAVMDMGEHQHTHLPRQVLGQFARRHTAQLPTMLGTQRLGHVQVGGKVALLTEQYPLLGSVLRSHGHGHAQDLVQVHRGGIGHHHFTYTGTQPRGQSIAQQVGLLKPLRRVVTADQAHTPLLLHHCLQAGGGGAGQCPQ